MQHDSVCHLLQLAKTDDVRHEVRGVIHPSEHLVAAGLALTRMEPRPSMLAIDPSPK
jgi:hypothetical protein